MSTAQHRPRDRQPLPNGWRKLTLDELCDTDTHQVARLLISLAMAVGGSTRFGFTQPPNKKDFPPKSRDGFQNRRAPLNELCLLCTTNATKVVVPPRIHYKLYDMIHMHRAHNHDIGPYWKIRIRFE
jgi:hypothetical protein